MSIDRSLERRVTAALADEAPQRAPTDLANTVLARTRQRSPRTRWLVLMTESPMRLEPEMAFGSSTVRSFGYLMLTLLVALLAVATVVVGASLLPRPTSLIPPDQGVFSVTGSMAWPWREHPTATLLADGRVLVIGGGGPQDEGPVLAELWDPKTGVFTPAGALHQARSGHSATLLPRRPGAGARRTHGRDGRRPVPARELGSGEPLLRHLPGELGVGPARLD